MGKLTETEQLKHKVAVFEARAQGKPEPKLYGDACPGCGVKVVLGEDSRVARCENSKCKILKVAV